MTTTTTTLFGDYHTTLQLSRVGAQVRIFAPVNTSWYIQKDGVSWKIILCHIIIQTCDFRVKSSNPPDVRTAHVYYIILSCVRFDWKYFSPVSRVGCASIYTHTHSILMKIWKSRARLTRIPNIQNTYVLHPSVAHPWYVWALTKQLVRKCCAITVFARDVYIYCRVYIILLSCKCAPYGLSYFASMPK